MIRSKHATPTTAITNLIPRPVVQSALAPSGDHMEILRSRHKSAFVQRFLAPGLPHSQRWVRFPLDFRGSRIWCLLDGQRTFGEIVEEYEYRYPGDAYQVPQRVWSYLKMLENQGFIEVVANE